MADLIAFVLAFAVLVLIGCSTTKRTPRAMHDAQSYLHIEHEAQIEQYRKDGRLPPK